MTATGERQQLSPDRILQLATGFMASKHLFLANEVGLFRTLANGPAALDQLAERTTVPRRTLRILADSMVALGMIERVNGRYQNGPVAECFLSGREAHDFGPLLRFWNYISYPAWLNLEQVIRTGRAPSHQGQFSEEAQSIFSAGVEALMAGTAQALAATYDFGRHRRILDLGGGTGSFLIAILGRHPNLAATLFESPAVVPIARQRLADGARQVAVVGGDFLTDPIPADHDAVLIANVAHLFLPERNLSLLRRVREAVQPGARLLLVDFWTDPTHTEPLAAALMAGEFLAITGEGDVYSEAEVRGWLRETGWRFVERHPLAGPSSLIVGAAVG